MLAIPVMFWLTLSTVLVWVSYSHSEAAIIADFGICIDEGLFGFQIPLDGLKPGESAETYWISYARKKGSSIWTAAGVPDRTPLRTWINLLAWNEGSAGMFFGFGYWYDDHNVTFCVPVWLVLGTAIFLVTMIVTGRVRFSIRALLILVTSCAGLVWLLMILRG